MRGGFVVVAGLAAGVGISACGGDDALHRALSKTRTADELTWRASRRCCERHTEFNRDDVRREREGVVHVVAGRWHTTTYRCPSAEQFAGLTGPTAEPRCR
jgi:hypothetical protein